MGKKADVDFDFEGGDVDLSAPSTNGERGAAEGSASASQPTAGASAASNNHGAVAAPAAPPGRGAPPPRDRIVILGRRAAGKTVYLARLYHELWKGRDGLSMRALSGQAHRACMDTISELKGRRWPASTLGSTYVDLEVDWKGRKQLLVMLDYPGEVFRRAFVDNIDAEDTRALIDHVDRASGIILLLDPAVAQRGDYEDFIDDDYGMAQAMHRVREWPGGDRVPIAVVFTKFDTNRDIVRDAGGLQAFCKAKYRGLLRGVRTFRLYGAVAVHGDPDSRGGSIPDLGRPPTGVIEPLRHCLEEIQHQEQSAAKRDAVKRAAEAHAVEAQEVAREERKATFRWSLAIAGTLVVLALVTLITWWLVNPHAEQATGRTEGQPERAVGAPDAKPVPTAPTAPAAGEGAS